MYAVVREITYKPGQELSDQEHDESEALLMALLGHYGQLTVDIGDGKFIRIAIWESEEGRTAIAERAENVRYREQYMPRMNTPVIGRGTVVSNSLIKS